MKTRLEVNGKSVELHGVAGLAVNGAVFVVISLAWIATLAGAALAMVVAYVLTGICAAARAAHEKLEERRPI